MNFRRWVVFTFLVHVLVVVVDKAVQLPGHGSAVDVPHGDRLR
jgi:hypothetical protein